MNVWHADYCDYPDCNCAEVYEPVPTPENPEVE